MARRLRRVAVRVAIMAMAAALIGTERAQAATPIGTHDVAVCTETAGWTCDADNYAEALSVHFYQDGPVGSGTFIGVTTANLVREAAVGSLCGGYAAHGFAWTIPDSLKDGTPHALYAYAINTGAGTVNPLLSSSPKSLTCAQVGPVLPNLTYSASELFKTLSVISSPHGHGTVAMHNGYLVVPFAKDGGTDGGFDFYDISNPRAPALVFRKYDSVSQPLREPHGFGFSNSYPGSYAVLQAGGGIQFWNWTDVRNPVLLKYLALPGITSTNYGGIWWVFWQAPYVYVGGGAAGLYIVDAKNPSAPTLVKQVPISAIGGFRIGPVFAVGNLLVATNFDGVGYATLDISDPVNPRLLKAQTLGMPRVYSAMVNGNRILGAGKDTDQLILHHIADPSKFSLVNALGLGGDGGYLGVQDGFVHIGASNAYKKIDIRNDAGYTLIGSATPAIADPDFDFATPLGNLVFVGNDHGTGSALVVHQTARDTTWPVVTMVNPAPSAVGRPLTSRIGLTFSDAVDLRSVTAATLIVRPLGGAALAGKYSHQTGIVNFSPNQPLAANTTYEIVVPAGGIRDYAGNPTPGFSSRFSTGPSVATPFTCDVTPIPPAVVGQQVYFSADVWYPPELEGKLKLAWDFGDGAATGFSSNLSSQTPHTYAAPGHYLALATVTDGTFQVGCSLLRTIHWPLTVNQPTASGTVVVDDARNRVWSVNPDHDTVTCFNFFTTTKCFEKPVGRHPRTLAQAPDGMIWVVNQDSATISILHPDTGSLVKTIALRTASRPYGIAMAPNGAAAYVTLEGTGELVKLDPATRAVVSSRAVCPMPRGIAVSHDSQRILVTRFISPADHGEVVEVSGAGFAVVRTLRLESDSGPDTESSGRGVPNYLNSVTISPDGRRAWVPSKKDNTERGVWRDGQRLTFESTVRTIVSQLNLTTNVEDWSARRDINDGDSATAVRFTPWGDYAFVALQGSNRVEIMDAYTGDIAGTIEDVGLAPQGLAMAADGYYPGVYLFVQSFLSRTLAMYVIRDTYYELTILDPWRAANVAATASEPLSATVLKGKRIFYNANDRRMNRDGYLSCASCHLDGGQDGRVWDFTDRGEGLRNTIMLRGRRGMGQGLVHWTANFDEIQDFEHDIRGSFGGTGFMRDADFNAGTRNTPLGDRKAGFSAELDALAAYVSSLTAVSPSPFRATNGTLTTSAAAGRALFSQLGCVTCHGGSDFTDSAGGVLHNVGTIKPSSGKRLGAPLTGLDTPTLLGVWETAPYLHNGSAATLMDVLTTANPAGLHGSTASLSATQRQQLVDYLAQIDEGELPTPGAVTPAKGSSTPGTEVTITATYTDLNGWQDLKHAFMLINTAISGANAVYLYYNQDTNKLYLRDDASTAWLGGCAPGASAPAIQNSSGRLSCAGTTVTGSGNTLTIKWRVTFNAAFGGAQAKNVYLRARDDFDALSAWEQKGTWSVSTIWL